MQIDEKALDCASEAFFSSRAQSWRERFIDAILAYESARPKEADGWRDIKSDPPLMDGQKVLVYRPLARNSQDEPVAIKRLVGGNNHCWPTTAPAGYEPYNPTDGSCHVTFWRPLPEPPSAMLSAAGDGNG